MTIDQTDLSLIRAIEWGGIPARNSKLRQLALEPDEVQRRFERLEQGGLIVGYRATISVPPFLGGRWAWGCTLIQTSKPDEIVHAIRSRIPFVTEILYNDSVPTGLGPNVSVLFYARDFGEIQEFLAETKGIEYVEVYQVDRYDYPLPQPFSSGELALIRALVERPNADLSALAQAVGETANWTQAKLERLVWDPKNTSGVVFVVPELDWRSCENFAHIHFLVELSVSPESVVAEAGDAGFNLVLEGRRFRKRYLQLDADVWGFSDLQRKKGVLDRIKGVHLAGILLAGRNTPVTDWAPGLLSQ